MISTQPMAAWRRYDEWRATRHERFSARTAHRLPGLRNRTAYRRLVVVEAILITAMVACAIGAFSSRIYLLPYGAAIAMLVINQTILRIVTGNTSDAPVPALDEIQLAQRNSARSLGFTALYLLMFIPYAILVALSTRDQVAGQTIYGVAILHITLVVAALILPTMLNAWWMSDPDPEDLR